MKKTAQVRKIVQDLLDIINENKQITLCIADKLEINELKEICKALAMNTVIQSLTIQYSLGDDGAKHIAEVIKVNKFIKSLSLYNSNIYNVGATYIAKALEDNQTLTNLVLSKNHIGNKGARALAAVLVVNQSLQGLYLDHNKINLQTAEKLLEAHRYRHIEFYLHLEKNKFNSKEDIKRLTEKAKGISGLHLLLERKNVKEKIGSYCFLILATAGLHPAYQLGKKAVKTVKNRHEYKASHVKPLDTLEAAIVIPTEQLKTSLKNMFNEKQSDMLVLNNNNNMPNHYIKREVVRKPELKKPEPAPGKRTVG